MIFQNFRTFRKTRISEKISKTYRNSEFHKRERSEVYRMERHSTSPPCGNLVDGLPHDCHTETIANLARLGLALFDDTPP